MAELLDPEVKWHGGAPSNPAACHNRVEAIEFMRRADRRAPGTLVDVVTAGADKVVVILRRQSPSGGAPELGANLTTFRDGKVVEMVHYPDPREALAAAGVEPPAE